MRKIKLSPAWHRTTTLASGKAAWLVSLFVIVLLMAPLFAAPQSQQANQSKMEKTDMADGKQTFERHCAVCHGIDGGGGRGPRLNRPRLSHAPDDAALRTVISQGLQPAMPDAWFLNDQEVANVAAYVRSLGTVPAEPLRGNFARGAAVYAKSACATCHILAGEGVGFGPDLTQVGERRSPSHIRKVVLNPGSALPENFLLVKIVTSSDKIVQGIRLNEDTFTIQLKDATGRNYSFRKHDLKELQKLPGETPMPSYQGVLSETDLDDLVAFLAASRGKS